jgi:hypothetical protein
MSASWRKCLCRDEEEVVDPKPKVRPCYVATAGLLKEAVLAFLCAGIQHLS